MPTLDNEQLIGIIQKQPDNPNFLETHRFRLVAARIPHVVYYVQEVNLPGFSMNTATLPTPLVQVPIHGDTVSFSDLTISFMVDEDMKNYKEILNWIHGLGFPINTNQHRDLRQTIGQGVDSDLLLMINTSHHNAHHYIMFRGAFPVSISDINFTTKNTNVDYPTVSVSFRYAYWEFIDV